ncbi:MAG: CARDB domain-containing protein [Methanobacteriota archaeon]
MKEAKKILIRGLVCVVTLCLVINFLIPVGAFSTLFGDGTTQHKTNTNVESIQQTQLEYTFLFSEPAFGQIQTELGVFTRVSMPGAFSVGNEPGTPLYLTRPIQLLLPQGTTVSSIEVESTENIQIDTAAKGIDLKHEQPIEPYQPEVPIGEKSSNFIMDQNAYLSNQPVPGNMYESLGVAYCRGYTILTFEVHPTVYIPAEGTLSYYPEVTVRVNLENTGGIHSLYRPGNQIDRQWVQSLVMNPEVADTYDASPVAGERGYPGGLCDPSDNGGRGYDYVIIVRASLYDFTGTYTWNDLISRKAAQGLDATKVKVEDITSNRAYWNTDALFNDTSAKIREFCKDAYQDWGASYVLVAGDQDGSAAIQRRLMDYDYESDCESDLYWSNLDNTFNADHDNDWGERYDTGFDLYSELFIGSIPCDVGLDISNWLTKSFYYEDHWEEEYLDNAAFFGGDSGWNCQGDDFVDFGAIKGTSNYLGPIPGAHGTYPSWLGFQYGFETWNAKNLGLEYDMSVKWTAEPPNPGWQGGSFSAAITGMRNAINNDQATLISAFAHADPTMSMDVYASDWESLYHNTKPFLVMDMGCHCGDMNAADDGVLHSMLFHSNTELAFACVYNTGYGWGAFDDTNTSSCMQMKNFWDYLFDTTNISGSTANWQLGKAMAWSKDAMAPTINWTYNDAPGSWRGVIESCLLFGDPAQLIKPPLMPEHNIGVSQLSVPTHVLPGQLVNVTATVINNGQNDESNIQVSFRINDVEEDHKVIPFLLHNTGQQVSFQWTPPTIGFYIVAVNVSIPGVIEDFYYDNEKSAIVVAGPDIAVTDLTAPDYAAVGRTTPISGFIENLGASNEWVTVTFKVNGVVDSMQQVYMLSGANTNVDFTWIPSVTGTYPIAIAASIAGDEPYLGNNELSKNVSVFIANGVVLVVDDDAGGSYESFFVNALMPNAYLYEVWNHDSQGSPSPSVMATFDVVIWFTGDDYYETVSTQDQTNLQNYLNAGGRLFITGQDIGYDIGSTNFYHNYLHATYQVDDAGPRTIVGTAGDPIGDGLTLAISGGDGANNQAWPDGIQTISPGTIVFAYQSSSYKAAIKTDTTGYKVVYFGFGFEGISTQANRNEVMRRVLTWLSPPRFTIQGDCYYQDFNPVNELTVDVTNLNTKRTWQASTNNNHYSLALTPGHDVNATETLRIIARDNQDSVNVTDHVVTAGEVTAGSMTLDLIVRVHYRDLKIFPFYPALMDTGAAVAQMMLNYLWWNSTLNPSGPPLYYPSQSILFTEFNSQGGLWINGEEMAGGLNAYAPSPIEQYGYFFSPSNSTNVNEVLQSICIWVDYSMSFYNQYHVENPWPKPGYPMHVPVAIPTGGNYNSWMTVRGIHTDQDAWMSYPDFPAITVYGLWLNDPKTGGLGGNTYVTTQTFLNLYFKTLNVRNDRYDGQYLAIIEPPQGIPEPEYQSVTIGQNPAGFSKQENIVVRSAQTMKTSSLMKDLANTIITEKARRFVNGVLQYDTSDLAQIFSETQVNKKPVCNGAEWIVTFSHPTGVVFDVRLSAITGEPLQFSVI